MLAIYNILVMYPFCFRSKSISGWSLEYRSGGSRTVYAGSREAVKHPDFFLKFNAKCKNFRRYIAPPYGTPRFICVNQSQVASGSAPVMYILIYCYSIIMQIIYHIIYQNCIRLIKKPVCYAVSKIHTLINENTYCGRRLFQAADQLQYG